ncbi:hypothetical protein J0895_03900 [Phormidium pseudopriestleyi FRX01]|uniref:Uncharacterized protein n=1 Tax=Phormidium pseudopriestleyi FRX01 TaxID=1759528 RepID=A0ABS3FMC2_9CYAN|nr:hypothetical protein [Phormidium pseudopriestleyi]MBO0348258.1 hypothetical protein [Phormidium pseudopriestleyi FRX01]
MPPKFSIQCDRLDREETPRFFRRSLQSYSIPAVMNSSFSGFFGEFLLRFVARSPSSGERGGELRRIEGC